MKPCRVCGISKPLEDYHRLAKSPDGRQPRCKACVSEYMREYTARNAEATRARVRAWKAMNPDRKKTTDAKATKKRNARRKAERHAAKASLVRYCEECAEPMPVEKHIDARFCSTRCQENEGSRRFYRTHKDKIAEYHKRYAAENRDLLKRKDHRRRALKLAAFVEDVHPLLVLERDDGVCGICGGDVDPLDFHVDHIMPLSRGGKHSYANVQAAHPACNLAKGARLLIAA